MAWFGLGEKVSFDKDGNICQIKKEKKEKKEKKADPKDVKKCYGDACKRINELNAELKQMRKRAKTEQELKLLSNLEGKILNLV